MSTSKLRKKAAPQLGPARTQAGAPASKSIPPKTAGSLGEQVYMKIKNDIITCVFAPGDSYSESQLAERYGVSKAPVRWALAALSRERLVNPRARQGYVVAPLTINSVKSLFELRKILESAAARLAVGHVDTTLLRSFEPKLKKYHSGNRDEEARWIMANQEFHLEIARASGNDWLFRAILNALEETRRITHVSLSMPSQISTMSDDHMSIIEAFDQGDGERAALLVETHIEKSLQAVLAAMLNSNIIQHANFDGRVLEATSAT